ncbi:MAG TPA: tetratricopeptide repeat protein, partial [Pyrinomonadaceae bacterium]|nr:tetratricopeptide repeat protein [Pyrinomonadaceae bacterium]
APAASARAQREPNRPKPAPQRRATPAPTPAATPEPTPLPGPMTRERRAQASAKMLEGQRYLAGARSGVLRVTALRTAQESFRQAALLDPTLSEAHTALAEIAFLLQDVEQAEKSAANATRINPDNFGARRILSRLHTLKSGLFEDNLDRARAEQAVKELREVVRLAPGDAEGWALLGEFQAALGRNDEAAESFRRWAAAPAPVESRFFEVITQGRELGQDAAHARLAELHLRAGRTEEALASIRRAIALAPENAGYLEILSRTAESGDPARQQAVLAELQRAVAANPSNAAAVSLLARTQARLGKTDEAVTNIRAALAKLGGANTRERFSLRLELAQLLADALRYDEAVAVYEELLKERRITTTPLTSENDRRFAGLILARMVNLRRQAGQSDAALAVIERMRRLLGDADPSPDLQHVLLLRAEGKREEALAVTRRARAKFPDSAEFARLEAVTLAEMGRVDEASEILRGRLTGQAEDYNEYLTLANLLMEAGRGKEAVEAARKALELAPTDRPQLTTQALLMLSSAQERAGDPKGSEETLRRILSKEPDNATALNNLGYFLVERNERLPEALEMIRRAVRAEPTNPSFLDSLGWVYFKLGQLDEAERYLSDAARRNPSSATIQDHLGDLYQRRGKPEQARAAWSKALSLSTETAETARIRAKLGGPANK